jgi:Malectin domain
MQRGISHKYIDDLLADIDTLGNSWDADTTGAYYSGGFSASNFGLSIQGTEDDTVYQTERTGAGTVSYNIPGLSSGVYRVELHFAEIYWTAAGSRLFDISIEGVKVATNFDVWTKAGGKGVAIVERYEIYVVDGVLSISFTTKLDQMKISGIAVLAAVKEPTLSPTVSAQPTLSLEPTRFTNRPSVSPSNSHFPSLYPSSSYKPSMSPTVFVFESFFINCGTPSTSTFVDSVGRQWKGDMYYNSGFTASNFGLPITNTLDDFIYQTERTGSGSLIYTIAVPPGEYKLDLHFAEIYWDAAKSRLIDIKVQGVTVATNFDMYVPLFQRLRTS